MVMDRNFKPGFRIDLHIKDLANALDTSHGVGAQLPLTAAVMEMMQALRADGLARPITARLRATTKNWRRWKWRVNHALPTPEGDSGAQTLYTARRS